MINLTKRSINALEKSTKAVQRDTAAKQAATKALRELIQNDEGAHATPPPVPKGKEPASKQSTSRKA